MSSLNDVASLPIIKADKSKMKKNILDELELKVISSLVVVRCSLMYMSEVGGTSQRSNMSSPNKRVQRSGCNMHLRVTYGVIMQKPSSIIGGILTLILTPEVSS